MICKKCGTENEKSAANSINCGVRLSSSKGFGKDVIIPKYKDINDLLDERVIEIIANNLDTLSDNFKKEYKIY